MQAFWGEFFNSEYMPHGHCYLWQPGILWTNVISDVVIAFAYFSIPFALLFLVKKRSELKFKRIFVLFALFILSCGVTHLFAVYTIWNGEYGLHGVIKAITAGVSALTALVLYANLDKLLAIPTPSELKLAQESAAEERVKRVKLEMESRTNSIFQFSIELFPTGVLVLDESFHIVIANKKLEEIFGYAKSELSDKSIDVLFSTEQIDNFKKHSVNFHQNPLIDEDLSKVSLVWGKTKSGINLPLELTISSHDLDGRNYTVASLVSVNQVGIQKKRFLDSSRRLQRAVDATDVGIWEWNLLTKKVWYSPKISSIISTGPDSSEIPADNWFSHVHPEDLPELQQLLDAHLHHQGLFNVVYRGKNNQNQYQWLRIKGDTMFDESEKPILMSGTLTSVDQTKQLQIELENKNQFLDAILHQANAAVFIIDVINRRLIFSNNQVNSLWGYKQDELNELLLSTKVLSIIHPDDINNIRSHFQQLKLSPLHKALSLELRVKHKRGHWVWCLFKNSVYGQNANGDVAEILGAATDVSEIKTREESNKKLAKEFLDTFEQAAVGIAHVGLDGSWLRVNGKICEILGYTRDELLSKTFQDITHPDDLRGDEAEVAKLISGKTKHYILEKRYIHQSGSPIWARLTVSIVHREDGSNNHFISVIEDISQQKQLENDLKKSNEELEQFAYVASHDLKEPLRTMQTYTSYLITDIKSNNQKRVEQDKRFIDSASKRMISLIDDLLRFSRIGNAEIESTQVNLKLLIEEVIQDLSANIEETNTVIELTNSYTSIVTDAAQLRIALQNLIQNAIKFCYKELSPHINISVEEPSGAFIKIHVKDNGIGIDYEYQQQIFGLFKKLHSDSDYQGTGLGLAIVKKIMHRLGGDVTLISEVGKGSVFTLLLPINK